MLSPKKLTIAVLGGAGKAGRPLVQAGLASGYHVRALLRHPEQVELTHERLTIIAGDARSPDSLIQVFQGCDAVLSTLGHPKGETVPIMADVAQHIVAAMQKLAIRRYIVVSSLFVTGTEQLDEPTRQAAEYMDAHFPLMMDNRRREFMILADSDLDWTYVRIPFLVQQPAAGSVDLNINYLPGQQITGPDLARFLLDQIQDRRYVRQALFIASKQS
jgi:putative NADH-flavin reductase